MEEEEEGGNAQRCHAATCPVRREEMLQPQPECWCFGIIQVSVIFLHRSLHTAARNAQKRMRGRTRRRRQSAKERALFRAQQQKQAAVSRGCPATLPNAQRCPSHASRWYVNTQFHDRIQGDVKEFFPQPSSRMRRREVQVASAGRRYAVHASIAVQGKREGSYHRRRGEESAKGSRPLTAKCSRQRRLQNSTEVRRA